MNIYEMHVLFRTLAQQMGMQKVRAILEESIDTYLNEAIIHIVQFAIQSNAANNFKENIATQYGKISTVNALSTLYTKKEFALEIDDEDGYNYIDLDIVNDVMYIIDFAIRNNGVTPFINCRLIEADRVEEVNSDFCNRASKRNPIITVTSHNNNSNIVFRCYLFTGAHNEEFDILRLGYIRNPNKVKFVDINSSQNVDCDLPVHLHTNVVEQAVELYMNSLGLTSNRQSQESGKQS